MATSTEIPGTGLGLGAPMGRGLAQGIDMLLSDIVEKKVAKIRRQQTTRGLTALGIPQAEAAQIALLPEKMQQIVIGSYLKAAESAGVEQALGGLSTGAKAQPLEAEQQFAPEQQFAEPMAPLGGAQAPLGLDAPGVNLGGGMGILRGAELAPPEAAQIQAQAAEPEVAPPAAVRRLVKAPPKKKPTTFAGLISKPRLSKEDRIKVHMLKQKKAESERKMSLKERKFEHKKQQVINKDTRKTYDKIIDDRKAARENNMRLDKMYALNKKGLTGPVAKGILQSIKKGFWGVGIDLEGLQNVPSQTFDKLAKDFLKNAKSVFGARVTEGEIRLLLKTYPSLNQSKEGRNAIIKILKMFNEAAVIRHEAMDKVIERNDGKRPANLKSLVEKMSGEKLDALSKKFTHAIEDSSQPKSLFRKLREFKPSDILTVPAGALRDMLFQL